MNDTQWLFEYQGLLKKEQRETERAVQIMKQSRRVLAHLLGLDLVQQAGVPPEEQPIVPLSLMCGRPEVLEKVLEEAQVEAGAQAALQDDEYERWSAMMAGEDMVPYDEPGPGTGPAADGAVWTPVGGAGESPGPDGEVD